MAARPYLDALGFEALGFEALGFEAHIFDARIIVSRRYGVRCVTGTAISLRRSGGKVQGGS